MTTRILFRSIAGIAAAAVLTLSLGACMSNEKSMKKSSGGSMQNSTMSSNDTMKSTTSSDSMNGTSSGNNTMKSDSSMSK